MGFLSRVFKPVSKVLDKIIPNEIKPALPYMAAFAPYFGPTSAMMGKGIMQRALISGGLNIGAQLAQEGNEGDINVISAGLGALQGAMTAPGAKDYFNMRGELAGEKTGILSKAKEIGFNTLGKGSGFIEEGLASGKLMDKAAVYSVPAAQATGDLMVAEGKRAEDAYKDALAAYEAEMGDGATDAGRALAIRTAMEAYGFLDDEIEDTIAAAGYRAGGRVGFDSGGSGKRKKDEDLTRAEIKRIKMAVVEAYDLGSMGSKGSFFDNFGDGMEQIAKPDLTEYLKDYMQGTGIFDKDFVVGGEEDILKKANGGRVGFRFGGIDSAVENIENQDVKESMKFASATSNMDIPMMEIVEQFELKFKRKPNSLDELKQFYKDKYGSQNIQEKLTETVRTTAAEGGLMNLGGKEMDMRTGGFIPIGKKERADDVPARLSKNEFVMTADAVRAAGGGSVNKGAKRMYEVMNKLEARA